MQAIRIRQNFIFEGEEDKKPLMSLHWDFWQIGKQIEKSDGTREFVTGCRVRHGAEGWGQLLSSCPPWLWWRVAPRLGTQAGRFHSLETQLTPVTPGAPVSRHTLWRNFQFVIFFIHDDFTNIFVIDFCIRDWNRWFTKCKTQMFKRT